jgi:hypothetical protein
MAVTTDSLIVQDAGGRQGILLSDLPSNGSNNELMAVTSDSLIVQDAGGRRGIIFKDIALSKFSAATDSISMGDFRIFDLEDPVDDQDAATKKYVDDNAGSVTSTAGSVFFADNLTGAPTDNNDQLFWDATNNRLGIGINTPSAKVQVNGQIRAASFAGPLNGGSATNPSYRFNSATKNDGMFQPGEDQLAFSAGGSEGIRLQQSAAQGIEVIVGGSLELTDQLKDETGNEGTAGQVLTSTGTGTLWVEPAVVAMGKANGANRISVNGATISGGAGTNTVNLNNPRPDADYIIQLTVQGNRRIFVTNQTANSFTVEIRNAITDALEVAPWYFTILDF